MLRFLRLRGAAIAIAAILASPAAADRAVLVELFTSQGCNTCPPADRLLGELAAEPGVIALGFHVDYWDYLGWQDTFARPAFSKRQEEYVGRADRSRVGHGLRGRFTPEMVLQGEVSLIGHDRLSIAERIVALRKETAPVELQLTRQGDRLTVSCVAAAGGVGEVRVMLAAVEPEATVAIGRGENAGKTLTYHRIVTDLVELGRWSGEGARHFEVAAEGPLVIFVQETGDRRILAAAELD